MDRRGRARDDLFATTTADQVLDLGKLAAFVETGERPKALQTAGAARVVKR